MSYRTWVFSLLQAAALHSSPAHTYEIPESIKQGSTEKLNKEIAYEFSLPLIHNSHLLGNLRSLIYKDGTIAYNAEDLIREVSPLLSDHGKAIFESTVKGYEFVSSRKIIQSGIKIEYNEPLLQLDIVQIPPSMTEMKVLGKNHSDRIPETIFNEPFSAYLNTNAQFRSDDNQNNIDPTLSFFGATRFRDIVFEIDGGYDDTTTDSGFYRRAARFVYDNEEKSRRYSLGDLRLDSLQIVGSTFVAGISVEEGQKIFDPFKPAFQGSAREIIFDQQTTIDVIANGTRVDTLQLPPGRYDIAQLPLRYGTNDIDLVISDASGRRALTGLDLYYNNYDLSEGEVEYNASIGYPIKTFSYNPEYQNDLMISGHYRKGVTNRVVLGGAIAASEHFKTIAGEVRLSPVMLPGYFNFSAAHSQSSTEGFALGLGYFYFDSIGKSGRQISLSANYESEGFSTASELDSTFSEENLAINASISQRFGNRIVAFAGATFTERGEFNSDQSLYAEILYSLGYRTQATFGVEYGQGQLYADEYGIRLGISTRFGQRHSGDIAYNSRRDEFRSSFSRSYNEKVGAFGYDVGVSSASESDSSTSDFSANYIHNRFRSRISYISNGSDLSSIGESNSALIQLGSSISYAGGSFAIGRPISDSFVIAEPHQSLSEYQVVVGNELSGEDYDSLSSSLGPALQPKLYSYSPQSLAYDFLDAPTGIDIGTGLETLRPKYRSGYHLVIGTDANLSAVGTLKSGSEVAKLAVGTIKSNDDEKYGKKRFFTNSAGRFAIIGLRPGKTYRIYLNESEKGFTIQTPSDGVNMLNMGEIQLSTSSKETGN